MDELTCEECIDAMFWDGVVICAKDAQRHDRKSLCNLKNKDKEGFDFIE